MSIQVYVADGTANVDMVRAAQAIVRELGGTINFDWTVVDQKSETPEQQVEACLAEVEAAGSCDLLIVCFPGGRGTHVGLGCALYGRAKRVLCFGKRPDFSVFYVHPKIRWAEGGMMEEIQEAFLHIALTRRKEWANPGFMSFPLNGVDHPTLAAMFGKGDFVLGNGEWNKTQFLSILPVIVKGDIETPVALPDTPEHDTAMANLHPEAPGIVLFFEKLADVERFEEAISRMKKAFKENKDAES